MSEEMVKISPVEFRRTITNLQLAAVLAKREENYGLSEEFERCADYWREIEEEREEVCEE